jgi:hypothetical protein
MTGHFDELQGAEAFSAFIEAFNGFLERFMQEQTTDLKQQLKTFIVELIGGEIKMLTDVFAAMIHQAKRYR